MQVKGGWKLSWGIGPFSGIVRMGGLILTCNLSLLSCREVNGCECSWFSSVADEPMN